MLDPLSQHRYTRLMKMRCILLLLLPLLTLCAACSPGHSGGNEIAFIRGGQLWTSDPNGANAFAINSSGPSVVGYNWSPTHQFLAFRTLDSTFADTPAAKQLNNNSTNGQVGDIQSTLNAIGVDGGTPIPTAFSSPDIRYSNAIWNPTSPHFLYRQTAKTDPKSPSEAAWIVAQSDQPGGIAAKLLPTSYSIPSFSYNTQTIAAISSDGIFTTTLAGTQQHFLLHTPLPGHPLVAPLERILWQPAHQNAQLLYASALSTSTKTHTDVMQVQLNLLAPNGHIQTLTTCVCTQFAWSPDGNSILYSTGTNYTLLNVTTLSSFTISTTENSIPYWSPDSQFLLLDGSQALILVQPAMKQYRSLLQNANPVNTATFPIIPTPNMLVQPVENNIWATDSRHFLFLTHDRLQWQNKTLQGGQGLYSTTLDDQGRAQGDPILVDKGNDSQASWTYQDDNTSFLY